MEGNKVSTAVSMVVASYALVMVTNFQAFNSQTLVGTFYQLVLAQSARADFLNYSRSAYTL